MQEMSNLNNIPSEVCEKYGRYVLEHKGLKFTVARSRDGIREWIQPGDAMEFFKKQANAGCDIYSITMYIFGNIADAKTEPTPEEMEWLSEWYDDVLDVAKSVQVVFPARKKTYNVLVSRTYESTVEFTVEASDSNEAYELADRMINDLDFPAPHYSGIDDYVDVWEIK